VCNAACLLAAYESLVRFRGDDRPLDAIISPLGDGGEYRYYTSGGV
jgi:hypothetical protein